jgi:hypothetical protein
MKYRLEEQYKSISAFKNIVQYIITSASLVVGLGGSLQLFNVQVDVLYVNKYKFLLISTIVIYLLLIALSLAVVFPVKVKGPTPADRDQLFNGFIWKTKELDILRQQLDNYLAAIDANECVILKRRKLAILTSCILPIIVILIILLSLIPRTVVSV